MEFDEFKKKMLLIGGIYALFAISVIVFFLWLLYRAVMHYTGG